MEQPLEYAAQGESFSYVSCDEVFMGSSRVHEFELQSLVVFSLPLASHNAPPILTCSLRRLRAVLSFVHST